MKSPKRISLLIVLLAIICCFTQKTNSTPSYFAYLYDAAGNRIERIYVPQHNPKRSIENLPFTGVVTISPNPATDKIIVKISDISKYKDAYLALYDINGSLLESKKNVNEETVFNLTGRNTGAYFISVTLDNTERNFKIIRIN